MAGTKALAAVPEVSGLNTKFTVPRRVPKVGRLIFLISRQTDMLILPQERYALAYAELKTQHEVPSILRFQWFIFSMLLKFTLTTCILVGVSELAASAIQLVVPSVSLVKTRLNNIE